jgi:predicted nucleic acid-binding protein
MALPGGYLLDTNILVHLLRNNDLGKYLATTYGLSTLTNPFILSVVTVGELYSLAIRFGWGAVKRTALDAILNNFTWVDISDRQILTAYGEIDAWSQANGRKMGKNDVWIAATARVTNTTVLTTDTDFDHLHPVHTSRPWRVDREWVDPNSKLPP